MGAANATLHKNHPRKSSGGEPLQSRVCLTTTRQNLCSATRLEPKEIGRETSLQLPCFLRWCFRPNGC